MFFELFYLKLGLASLIGREEGHIWELHHCITLLAVFLTLFGANSTKSYEKNKPVCFHAFSSKQNFESPLKTYLVIDNVEEGIVNISSKKNKIK